jgi:hypothetical protein
VRNHGAHPLARSFGSCVNTYLQPLSERQGKDEYASHGYLNVGQRTKLLSEWLTKPSIKAALDKARPEIEKLQRSRDETALSPRDQRYMPSNMGEALMLASRDEEEAEAARRSSSKRIERRSHATTTRNATSRAAGSPAAAHAAAAASGAGLLYGSPIQKRRL